MADYLNLNAQWLEDAKHPKLILAAKPGMLMNDKVLKWASDHLSNLEIQHLGKAKHLMEEDLPHEIGMAIQKWYSEMQ